MKPTINVHRKIGYVTLYLKFLNNIYQYKPAGNYAKKFLVAHENEIMQYSWHVFFSVFLETLLHQQKYDLILKLVKRYALIEKDELDKNKANYMPTIVWYYETARFLNGNISQKELKLLIEYTLTSITGDEERKLSINRILRSLEKFIPNIVRNIQPLS